MQYIICIVETEESKEVLQLLWNSDLEILRETFECGTRCITFMSDILSKKNLKALGIKPKNRFLAQIQNNPRSICPTCGTHSNHFLLDYRDNCGCVGKTISCANCYGISDKAIRQVIDARLANDVDELKKLLNC